MSQLTKKISELTTVNELKNSDFIPIVQNGINKKITGELINNISSQLETKANKSETQNIQQQVNNLVLGAVGNGNNAEVIQSRGAFDLLGTRLNESDYFFELSSKIISNNKIKSQDFIGKSFSACFPQNVTTTIPLQVEIDVNDFTEFVFKLELEGGEIYNTTISYQIAGKDYNGGLSTFKNIVNNQNFFFNMERIATNVKVTPYGNTSKKIIAIYFGKAYVTKDEFKLGAISNRVIKIENDIIDIKEGRLAKTKNIFNEKNVILNSYLDANGNIQVDNQYGWKVSEMISVDSNKSYVLSRRQSNEIIQRSYFYDINKKVINEITTNPFITPPNCKYVRFSIQNKYDGMMLEQGVSRGYYIPFGYNEDYDYIIKSKWLDKKYCCIGDSITDNSEYVRLIADRLGLILVYDNGRAGTTVGFDASLNVGNGEGSSTSVASMCTNVRVNLIPEDTQVITILGGANDWAGQGLKLGNIDSPHEPNTFFGAYQLMLDRIYSRIPNVEIILLEPTFRNGEQLPTLTTHEGFKFDKYRKAVQDIAYKYGLKLVKTYQNAGINQFNYTIFLKDDVHPNVNGINRIANVCVNDLRSY